ncbi:hypothetical protein [Halogeometricum pallidum]|uniref:hypothetical protein n=1 Tax=Halogeometricum pallidum TaxID=411361 RepID=UPI001360B69B|nr:hypothetical protein [Halogeometricum pallidum]
MPSTDFHGTHTLLSSDYVDALTGLSCEDAERAASVAAFLAGTLQHYDGREIRA